jgi:hypothetical protein
MVKLMSLCRAKSCATFGCTPLFAKFVMKVFGRVGVGGPLCRFRCVRGSGCAARRTGIWKGAHAAA